MPTVDVSYDYAIELPGRGYISSQLYQYSVVKEPVYTSDISEADSLLAKVRQRYIEMGAAELAHTLRVVTRSVTVTRGDWVPERQTGTISPVGPNAAEGIGPSHTCGGVVSGPTEAERDAFKTSQP